MSEYRHNTIANPLPAGVISFASTTWLFSMYNVHTLGIQTPNVIIGMALFCGGLTQFIAGLLEFPRRNTFSATVLTCYGGFWLAYATMYIPSSGVLAAYDGASDQLANALGLYLLVWFIITLLFIIPVMRRNVAFTIVLSTLAVSLLLQSLSQFTASERLAKGGAIFGIITGLVAFYIGLSELLLEEDSPFVRLPLGDRHVERKALPIV